MALTDKLTAIADGFRTSRGTTEKYTLDQMAEMAAEAVGGSSSDMLSPVIDGTVMDVYSPISTAVRKYAFYECKALASVDLPATTGIYSMAFSACSALASANLPEATFISSYAFEGCSSLTSIKLPKVTTLGSYAFQSCTSLTSVDLSVANTIVAGAFKKCSKLTSLVIRSTAVCTLQQTSAFDSTPIAAGTGYIYVPAALLSAYRSATNWSTFYSQFRSI